MWLSWDTPLFLHNHCGPRLDSFYVPYFMGFIFSSIPRKNCLFRRDLVPHFCHHSAHRLNCSKGEKKKDCGQNPLMLGRQELEDSISIFRGNSKRSRRLWNQKGTSQCRIDGWRLMGAQMGRLGGGAAGWTSQDCRLQAETTWGSSMSPGPAAESQQVIGCLRASVTTCVKW